MEAIYEKIMSQLGAQMPSVLMFALKVVICIAVFLIGRRVIDWAVRTIRNMMERSMIQAGAVTFASSMTRVILYAFLVIWIGIQFGLKESSVAAAVASFGVAIGLALQGGLSNLAGGFLILLFRPFEIGDYIVT